MPDGKPIVKDISGIVGRAQSDKAFKQQLEHDPMGAAHAAGFRLTWDEVRQSLGLPQQMSEAEMKEHIQQAVSGSCTTTIKF